TFALKTYTVNGIATAHGKIDNLAQSDKTVSHGGTTSFTIIPDTGYVINYVLGCNGNLIIDPVTGIGTYTTGTITGPCKVIAFFKRE
ncbi:MAG: hypothetical protein HQK64_13700, partial [Desulfamplus sp.]|nr:hypothetical protein [Desulfamplus sp.]